MQSTAAKAKTTFHIDQEVLDRFTKLCNNIGLRRDRYLNGVLPLATHLLAKSTSKNSPDAETFTRLARDVVKAKLRKVVVSLDTDVIEELSGVCADKRVPRDVIFEEILKPVSRTRIWEWLYVTFDGRRDSLRSVARLELSRGRR